MVDLEKLDVTKFGRGVERDCQEAAKWERRKLEWILQEQQKSQKSKAA